MYSNDKDRHRRHRAHDEHGRVVASRFDCVWPEALAEEKCAGAKATNRKARIARNRATKKSAPRH